MDHIHVPDYEGPDRRSQQVDRYGHRNTFFALLGTGAIVLITVVGAWVSINQTVASLAADIKPLAGMQSSLAALTSTMASMSSRVDRNERDIGDLRTSNVATSTMLNTMSTTLTQVSTEIHDRLESAGKRK